MKKCLLASLLVFFCGCHLEKDYKIEKTDGFKKIINYAKPQRQVKLQKKHQIQGYNEDNNPDENSFYEVNEMKFDEKNNLYLSDKNSFSIKKYSPNGHLLTSFLKQGNGPGEIKEFISNFTIIKDTVYVQEYGSIMKFTLEGNYTGSINTFERYNFHGNTKIINDSLLFTYTAGIVSKGDDYLNDNFIENNYTIMNSSFKQKELFETHLFNFKDVMENDVDTGFCSSLAIAANRNFLYTATRKPDKYLITRHELKTKDKLFISKELEIIHYSDTERQYIQNNLSHITHGNIEKLKNIHQKKQQISHLHYDKKNDYLWIEKSMNFEKSIISFDIFKDGRLVRNLDFPVSKEAFFPLRNESYFTLQSGKLYFYDIDNNKIVVYQIEY